MITRRQIFGFFGLGFVALASRWRIFAQHWRAEFPDKQEPTPLTPEQIAQTPPEKLMMKVEGKDLAVYLAGDKRRFEYHDKHKVVIERADLNELVILNMNDETYSIQPYQRKETATFSSRITRGKPKPDWTPFYHYDPALFEIPANFKKA
jgi:hypothetical protein